MSKINGLNVKRVTPKEAGKIFASGKSFLQLFLKFDLLSHSDWKKTHVQSQGQKGFGPTLCRWASGDKVGIVRSPYLNKSQITCKTCLNLIDFVEGR